MNIKTKDVIFLALIVTLGGLSVEILKHLSMNLFYQIFYGLGIFKKEQV